MKSRRTILCHGVDQLIYNHTAKDIEEEIEKTNVWAKVKEAFKFPTTNRTTHTMKIIFEDANMAAKAEADGIRLFNMSIAYHQVKRETYTPIKTCLRCYKIEEHNTSECPQPREYKACSECASHEHTWRNCKSPTKRCLNCDQDHRTLAMKCPKRKEAVKKKQTNNTSNQNNGLGTYAKMASAHPSPNQAPTPNMEEIASKMTVMMFCLYNAHLMNAVNPGCLQDQLDHLTSANNLPRMVGPRNPPSADILNTILNSNILRHQQNTVTPENQPHTTNETIPTHQKAPEQTSGINLLEESTTESSSDSEPEELTAEGNHKQEAGNKYGSNTETTLPASPTHTIHKKKHTKKHKTGTLHKTTTWTTKRQNQHP